MHDELLADWRMDEAPDRETMLLWLSAGFVVEFDRRRNDLEEAAAADGELLWQIRCRLLGVCAAENSREIFSHWTLLIA